MPGGNRFCGMRFLRKRENEEADIDRKELLRMFKRIAKS